MFATRWLMLVVSAGLILAAVGASDLQPSTLRVAVTAVIGLLAPLYWPGRGATPARTALRVAAWSFAAACLAAIIVLIIGSPRQRIDGILAPCVMLMLVLLVTHALVADLEGRLGGPSADAGRARELAGRTVAAVLVVLGTIQLWLGPVGELLASRNEWIIDAIVGISPLTHLAVASGNDLLRNQWFYQHSNLAALRFSYPSLAVLTVAYASVALVLILFPLASLRRRRPSDSLDPT